MEDGVTTSGELPTEDESNVIESESIDTSLSQKEETKEVNVEAPAEEPREEEKEEGSETDNTPSVDLELLQKLSEASKYKAQESELDILDEYGAVDPTKFQDFMLKNNQQVFNQAVNAVQARLQAERIEEAAWQDVTTKYPELKESESLLSALRGARVQDLVSGGKGDLLELAKGIVAPIRDSKIKAVESVNKSIKKQESLSTFKPATAQIEKVPTNLMDQLKQAIATGNSEEANRLRHEVRKERIFGKADD